MIERQCEVCGVPMILKRPNSSRKYCDSCAKKVRMENQKIALKNFTEEELKEFMKEIGEKPFRGTQIYSWIYKGAKTFDDMKNIPKSLREKLGGKCEVF